MKIIDPVARQLVRDEARCAWCGQPGVVECAHILHAGMGGGGRLDVAINMLPLCRKDHAAHHAGHRPLQCDLLALSAARHETTADAILEKLAALRKMSKWEEFRAD